MGDRNVSLPRRPSEVMEEVALTPRRPTVPESIGSPGDGISDLKFLALLRHHLRDWLVILVCIITDVGLNVIHPYNRYVGKYNIDSLRNPLKTNTVPLWSVPIIAILIPLTVFIGYLIKRKDTRDFHQALLGLLTAVGITAVFTDALKDGVGRARPDFYWRCFANGVSSYDPQSWQVICNGDAATIREGYKSFPSGHSSWSFSGLGYLSFYLAGKLTLLDRRGYSSRLLIVLFPLLAAALVAVSRVSDYWHHWQDVTVGGLLGLTIAFLSYKQHFPYFSETLAGSPYPHARRSSTSTIASRSPTARGARRVSPHGNGRAFYDLESQHM